MSPAPAALGLGVDGLGWRDVVDVRTDMERVGLCHMMGGGSVCAIHVLARE